MPRTQPPTDEELSATPAWEIIVRNERAYLRQDMREMELGAVDEVCEKLAGWLANRDFGGA